MFLKPLPLWKPKGLGQKRAKNIREVTSRWSIIQVSFHILMSPPSTAWGYYFTVPDTGVHLGLHKVQTSSSLCSFIQVLTWSLCLLLSYDCLSVSDKLEKYVWQLLSLLCSMLWVLELWFWRLTRVFSLSRLSFKHVGRNGDGESVLFSFKYSVCLLFFKFRPWMTKKSVSIYTPRCISNSVL